MAGESRNLRKVLGCENQARGIPITDPSQFESGSLSDHLAMRLPHVIGAPITDDSATDRHGLFRSEGPSNRSFDDLPKMRIPDGFETASEGEGDHSAFAFLPDQKERDLGPFPIRGQKRSKAL
jgi:hypothetical protein